MCVQGKDVFFFGKRSEAKEAVPAREHVFLGSTGFESTAHPFLVVPLPDPVSIHYVTRVVKEEAALFVGGQGQCSSPS